MIERPRALRIFVADLPLGTQWYRQAFDMEASDIRPDAVRFDVQGFVVLLVPGPTPAHAAPVVYWGVDDVASERDRLLTLQTSSDPALVPLHDGAEEAVLYDPFGNAFGLTSLGESGIRRARNQRSAEKIALRQVRGTLDDLQRDEQAQRKTRNMLVITGLAIALILVLAGTLVVQRAKSLKGDAPLTIPQLKQP